MLTRVAKLAFNRGLVSRLGLARADVKRLAMAAEAMTNWMPRVLGSMMLRPGLGYLGESKNNASARYLSFIFSVDEKALLELTDFAMRVWIDDALVTRPAVTSAVTNGNFDTTLAGWTDNDEAGAVSQWVAGGFMYLVGTGTLAAIRDQTVTVPAGSIAVEHALRIVIDNGPVMLRVGSTVGGDEYINETELATGTHSLVFTPSGDFRIRFFSRLKRIVRVDSCNVEAAGVLSITAPWAVAELRKVRYDQSGDVLFVACDGYPQYKIERRATRSWSVVRYYANDGPFMIDNTGPITMVVSDLSGNVTLQASAPYFQATNIGSLFRLTSEGQRVTASVIAENQFTNAIRVAGVGNDRIFTVSITEVGAATFTLQRSLASSTGPWSDAQQWTATTTVPFNDGLDNQIAWYRLGVKTGDFVAGTHAVELAYSLGSITGIGRVTDFTTAMIVGLEVLVDFGGTVPTSFWAEGSWSARRDFPTAVTFHEGRLVWTGRDAVDLSISDAFDSFDDTFLGDAGPISRTIGSGPVDTINWVLSLQRLLIGGQGAEFSIRTSSLDEPLTPTNFNLKTCSTQGSAPVTAVKVDQNGIFVQRGGTRIFELAFGTSGIDYEASQLSALVPEIGEPGIIHMAVQGQPETRVHCVRSDGTVAMLIFDRVEQVVCWIEVETDGVIEDVVVLPGAQGDTEDLVYYSVKRTINGVTKRFLEKWAFENVCRGASVCKLADAFVVYSGVAATVIPVAHLVGKQVVVWADGHDVGTNADGSLIYTVSAGGTITLAAAASNVVVGLPYSGSWMSAKLVELLGYMAGNFTDTQMIKSLGLLLADVHAKGLKYGHNLTESEMQDLPGTFGGAPVDPDSVSSDYAVEPLAFPGQWSVDARLCLLAKAPRPATVLAALAELEHHG